MSAIFVTPSSQRKHMALAAGVLLLHGVALWALQAGLLQRMVEVVMPVELVSEFIDPPRSKVEPPPAPPPKQPVTPAQAVPQKGMPLPPPMPVAIADATPAPQAPTGVLASAAPLPPMTAPQAAAPAPVALPAPKVELPSSDADYLQNPKPAYPPMSKRLGEQGRVVVRVLIGVDGGAQKAEIRTSSGFERLDQAALATAQRWRYVPGKRGGVAEAMWFSVPVNFVLE